MDEDRQRRVAENESMSREANEAIEKALWEAEEGSSTAFLCECARPDCHHVVQATLREYERVRAHPRRFMVHPGHEEPEAERIVDTQSDYLVVEKNDEAGRVAETETLAADVGGDTGPVRCSSAWGGRQVVADEYR